jgi:UDP-N-acetylmuramoyl-L-alanyl-D-glutamate--2,6-diaminopimelate ligase
VTSERPPPAAPAASSAAPALSAPVPLAELVTDLTRAEVRGDPRTEVRDVVYRSTEVRPGALFFCVPGAKVDGHTFAGDAARGGAAVLVAERWLDAGSAAAVPQVLVPSVREAMGPVSAAFFAHPDRRMTLVGVTGTNGKTTTTYVLESIFRAAGMVPGVIGTTGVRIVGRPVPFDRTTPEAPDLQRLLARMVDEGVTAAAMEVSSHGLHQHRVDGARYAVAIFTNLTRDHLDYHGTLEEYFRAKALLFTPAHSEQAVVNHDSPEGRRLADAAEIPTVTFGLEPGADLVAEDVRVTPEGLAFRVQDAHIRSRLRGLFNVSNCLGAFAAARLLGIEDAAVEEGIAAVSGVPGRLEPVEAGQAFPVLVDYAHTPDSLENVLRATRGMTAGRVIVVFGCGGDRDRGKRPLIGQAATRLADLTIITSDNPRSEDPEAIIAEIEAGARRGGGAYLVEPDRRVAIRMAVSEAGPGDLVLIAGKGHESGQEFRDRTIPFDDRIVAAEELAARDPAPSKPETGPGAGARVQR